MPHTFNYRWVGAPRVPHDIRILRQSNLDMAMKLGNPAVWRHKFGNDDKQSGYRLSLPGVSYDISVVNCPACYNSYRGQVRADCEVCFATGFCSSEKVTDEWITEDGELTDTDLGSALLAPKWRGFGPSVLIYVVEPDAAVDVFKLSPQGAIIKTQDAQAFAPWDPPIADNDLIINVRLESDGTTIQSVQEMYETKLVNPVSIRGWGKAGRGPDDHIVAQQFEMIRVPSSGHVYNEMVID